MSSSPPEPGPAQRTGRALRVAVVGLSTDPVTCGVRDHATLLAQALGEQGVECTLHWLSRRERSLAGSWREVGRWARRLARELAEARPDAVLLHYSVFTISHRGVPLFVPGVLRAARGCGAPLASILHEYAYPWGRSGLRGLAWALTQRAFLVELVRASDALVVTADFRAAELQSRRWLPRRRIAIAPVFSNLPAPRVGAAAGAAGGGGAAAGGGSAAIGLFGYASEGTQTALALDALAVLRGRGRELALRLLGAPGADSEAGRAWRAAAGERGLDGALSFSGTLSAQELADALAACELLLFAESTGPNPRKTTLAASLASGRPVVAVDGPRRWQALADAGAARISPPSAAALAGELGALLDDPAERARLGERGRAFAQREMSPERAAQLVAQLLRAIAPGRP